ncbi:ABC transporter ATP-binding protein [Nocardia fluminea]|uniref:ATP-binding cassette domain-containing protein n=1 Tax=Nocardia fluminea TaxID=134984 RepID=UPI00366FB84A
MTAELCCLTVRVDTTRWSETVLTEVDLVVPAGQITAVLGGPGRLPATAQSRGQVLIDGEVADLLPHQHSGGQIQRAALAAALLPAPRVLIADGPTNSLDMGTAYGVWRSLRDYADSGAAVLVVSNEVRMLTHGGVADRMVILHEGRVLAAGTTAELGKSTDTFVRTLLRSAF